MYFFLLANDQFYQDEATAQAILAHFDETEAPVYMLTHLVQHFLLEEIHMTPQLEKIRPQFLLFVCYTFICRTLLCPKCENVQCLLE